MLTLGAIGSAVIPAVEKSQAVTVPPYYSPSSAYITLSPYYALPNQDVRVSGHGFIPGESVTIQALGETIMKTADGSGSFTTEAIDIPFAFTNSIQEIRANGDTSNTQETTSMYIGGFYPVVTPSEWYMPAGTSMTFTAIGFGPGEKVEIYENGLLLDTATAGSGGSFSASHEAPDLPGQTVQYRFVGRESGASYMLHLHIAL